MTDPRPVPSECVDTTPAILWNTLWQLDPNGTLEMPHHEPKTAYGLKIAPPFWKGQRFFDVQKQTKLPPPFWQVYTRMYPHGGHPCDTTPSENYDRQWNDREHGYWRGKDGRLQYRSQDGKIHLDVTGTDQWK